MVLDLFVLETYKAINFKNRTTNKYYIPAITSSDLFYNISYADSPQNRAFST